MRIYEKTEKNNTMPQESDFPDLRSGYARLPISEGLAMKCPCEEARNVEKHKDGC